MMAAAAIASENIVLLCDESEPASKKRALDIQLEPDAPPMVDDMDEFTLQLEEKLVFAEMQLADERAKNLVLQSKLKHVENQMFEMQSEIYKLRYYREPQPDQNAPTDAKRALNGMMMPPPPRVKLPPLPEGKHNETHNVLYVNREHVREWQSRNVRYVPGERRAEILIPQDVTDHDLVLLLMRAVFCEQHARHQEWKHNFRALMTELGRLKCVATGMGALEFEGGLQDPDY